MHQNSGKDKTARHAGGKQNRIGTFLTEQLYLGAQQMPHAQVKRRAGDHRNGRQNEKTRGRGLEKPRGSLRIEGAQKRSRKTGEVLIAGAVQDDQIAEPARGSAEAGRQNMLFNSKIISKREACGSLKSGDPLKIFIHDYSFQNY